MKIIVTALHCEAIPIIEALKMEKSGILNNFDVYSNGGDFLVISGVGRLKSAIATTALLTRLSAMHNLRKSVVFNVGICGAKPEYLIGDLLFPYRISCNNSRRSFYPDLLIKHNLKEASLFSAERPVFSQTELQADCVDMESYGFFEAASSFLTTSQIFALKVVSDHCENKRLSKKEVSDLIATKTDQIIALIQSHASIQIGPLTFSEQENSSLCKLVEQLRLTACQTEELRKIALSSKVRGNAKICELPDMIKRLPRDKQQSKVFFEQVKIALNS